MGNLSYLQRLVRRARSRVVYVQGRDPTKYLRLVQSAINDVAGLLPSSAPPEPFPEERPSGVFPIVRLVSPALIEEEEEECTSVLSLPRRDRDPAMVQQEILGCRSLLLEIIRRAAYDWVLYRSSRRLIHKKLAEQAYHWLFVETEARPEWQERVASAKQITSFTMICTSLNLDPVAVRTHVKKLTPKNVMSVGRPPEYRRRPALPRGEECDKADNFY